MSSTPPVYNTLYDPATNNLPIAPEVQAMLNQPAVDATGFDAADEAFLMEVVAQFDSGKIQPYSPSSLLKTEAYEQLDEAQRGKADQNALNILTHIREIYGLWKANPVPTFQIQNQIHHIRLIKERVEGELGDVYTL